MGARRAGHCEEVAGMQPAFPPWSRRRRALMRVAARRSCMGERWDVAVPARHSANAARDVRSRGLASPAGEAHSATSPLAPPRGDQHGLVRPGGCSSVRLPWYHAQPSHRSSNLCRAHPAGGTPERHARAENVFALGRPWQTKGMSERVVDGFERFSDALLLDFPQRQTQRP
jgi:hypothetical protein